MFMYCVTLRRASVAAWIALAWIALAFLAEDLSPPATAGEVKLPRLSGISEAFAGHVETSTGVDATQTSWSSYSTAVIAPFGPLDADGLRLKLYGSVGGWSYDTRQVYCPLSRKEQQALTGVSLAAECNALADPARTPGERQAIAQRAAAFGLELEGDQLYLAGRHQVMRTDLAVMPGWQVTGNGVALKGYLGAGVEARTILPHDADKALSGTYWGAKTALESWAALGPAAWLTADVTYFTGTDAYTATMRLGWEPISWLTLGPEAATFGDAEDESTRAGGFLRFNVGKAEATLSGGMALEHDGSTGPYGQASVYMKF